MSAGCTSGPDYRPPQIVVAPAWSAAAPSGPVEARWSRAFGDATLDALVASALSDNPSIDVALARVDQARAAAAGVRADRLPAVDAEGTAARSMQSLNAGLGQLSRYVSDLPRTTNFGAATVGASWELDFAGGQKRQRERAEARVDESRAGVEAARLGVVADLADAYVTLRGVQAQRAALTDMRDALSMRYGVMRVRVAAGAASTQALVDSGAILAAAESALAPLAAVEHAARVRIAILIGRSPSSPMPALERGAPQARLPEVAAGLPGDVLRGRPDVAAAEARLVAANAGIGAALAEYWPKLSLSALAGFQSNRLDALVSGDSATLLAGLGLRWRLFDFGRVDALVAAARGGEREALAAYRLAVLEAAGDVEKAFGDLDARRRAVAALQRRRDAAAAAIATAEAALRAGGTSRDALFEARAAGADAEAALASARRDALRATVAAYRALGAPP